MINNKGMVTWKKLRTIKRRVNEKYMNLLLVVEPNLPYSKMLFSIVFRSHNLTRGWGKESPPTIVIRGV